MINYVRPIPNGLRALAQLFAFAALCAHFTFASAAGATGQDCAEMSKSGPVQLHLNLDNTVTVQSAAGQSETVPFAEAAPAVIRALAGCLDQRVIVQSEPGASHAQISQWWQLLQQLADLGVTKIALVAEEVVP